MKKCTYIIFDLDGTLMDTSPGILRCIEHVLDQYGLKQPSQLEMRNFIGPPIEKSFQTYYGFTEEYSQKLAATWRKIYKEQFLFEAVPYRGIYDLLQWLRTASMKTAVATNKREDYTTVLLEHFNLLPFLDCVVGSDSEGRRTKADMIGLCINQMGATGRDQCLMIGDTIGDMAAAHRARVDFLGVTYGFGFKKGGQEADCETVDSCENIRNFLQRQF